MTDTVPFDEAWLNKYGPIVARSHGHYWFHFQQDKFMSCRLCGMIRRADDKNSPCKGRVRVELRLTRHDNQNT